MSFARYFVGDTDMDAWVERELAGCHFPDQRLKTRLGKLLGDLGATDRRRSGADWPSPGLGRDQSRLPGFFDNQRVDEGIILSGHFAATTNRFVASAWAPILVLHDTTEFSFRGNMPEAIGRLTFVKGGHATYVACGVLWIVFTWLSRTKRP